MHGVLVLDKPAGVSSHDALAPVKAAAGGATRVGHAGTLDPFATGVLLALVGDGTRLSELAMGLPKEYVARIRFGRETDTLDPEGRTVAEADPGAAPPPGWEAVLARFMGEIDQVPPQYSALKVGGRRAYRIAREGGRADLPPRRVRIDAVEVVGVEWPEVVLRVTCGAGTYLRSLARDVGRALELPASLAALRRRRIGPFRAEDADGELRPLLDLVRAAGVAEHPLADGAARDFLHGGAVAVPPDTDLPDRVAVVAGGMLLGFGRPGGGELRPTRVLRSAQERFGV